jgi:crotonobetainyl-CoA:carnitine CoA-transferase CaiB-like acyl-CoA transferase
MYAYTNILAARLERGKTGRGKRIDISMLESMVEWMGFPLYYAFDGAEPPPRAGAAHATIYPYGPFPTGDGKTVMLGLQNEREWVVFCEAVLGEPDLATHPDFASNSLRNQNRAALRARIVESFSGLTATEAVDRLEAARIANARVNTIADVWDHPQLAARQRWRQVDTPVGPVPALLPPGMTEARMDPIPSLGANTDAILAELGQTAAQIAALRSAGAV